MRRGLLVILLVCLLAGATLRSIYAVHTPADLDETHYGIDALWSHPAFPDARGSFLRSHPQPHRVLSRAEWTLVTHATREGSAHGWALTRVGHPMLHGLLLGEWLWPFMRSDAPSPGAEVQRLRTPMRLLTALLDLMVLGLLVVVAFKRWGPWAAGGAGGLYALAPWIAGSAAMIRPDPLMTLLLVVAVLLLDHARERSERDRHVLAAGVLLGLAVATKQSAVLFFPVLGLGLYGARRWPLRLVFAAAVALPVAVVASDVSLALRWANTDAHTSIPPDLLRNAAGMTTPSGWWMLGNGFALTIETSLATLTGALSAPLLGLLAGGALLAVLGERRRLSLALLGLALLPSFVLPHGGAVYRLLPVAWLFALLFGLGVAEVPRARKPHLGLAIAVTVVVAVVFGIREYRSAAFYAHYRGANSALTEYFSADPAARDPAKLSAGQAALDAALEVRPGACPALMLRAQVELVQGQHDEARALVIQACKDPWSSTYPPMVFPSGTDALLALPERAALEYLPHWRLPDSR